MRKRKKKFYKWLAFFMSATLLIGQNSFPVMAEGIGSLSDGETGAWKNDTASGNTEGSEAGKGSDVSGNMGESEGGGESLQNPEEEDSVETENGTDMEETEKGTENVTEESSGEGRREGTPEETETAAEAESETGSSEKADTVSMNGIVQAEIQETAENLTLTEKRAGQPVVSLAANPIRYFTVDSISYRVINAENCEVELYSAKDISKTDFDFTIPSEVAYQDITYKVTGIGSNAFENSHLTSVTISESITKIDDKAFRYSNLTSLIIPANVTKIGEDAFSTCFKLNSVTIQANAIEIGNRAFDNCQNLNSVTLSGVTKIGEQAFYQNKALRSIEIPESVTEIGRAAFCLCEQLTDVKLPAGLTKIAEGTFGNCSGLKKIVIPEGVTEIGDSAFASCRKLENVIISENVKVIGNNAFEFCGSLTEIKLPYGLQKINSRLFYECINLKMVEIPETVTEIGKEAFWNCEQLKGIELPYGLKSIGDGAFGQTGLLSIKIPETVTQIGESVFVCCAELKSVELPDGLKELKFSTFDGTSNLRGIKLPEALVVMGPELFWGSGLYEIVVPDGVQGIGTWAFRACADLQSVEVPSGLKKINGGAFTNCKKFNTLKIRIDTNNLQSLQAIPLDQNNFSGEDGYPFWGCPSDRSIIFLTADGTQRLTGSALKKAQRVYMDAEDGNTKDNLWEGWKIADSVDDIIGGDVGNAVNIAVRKDGQQWTDSQKAFQLTADGGTNFITDLKDVPDGTFEIYESLGDAVLDTGISVTVAGADAEAVVDYYTVTFLDGDDAYGEDTPQKQQIILSGQKASRPDAPTKSGYSFTGWMTEKGGSTAFSFDTETIKGTTKIYAGWKVEIVTPAAYAVTVKVQKDDKEWVGSNKNFVLSLDGGKNLVDDLSHVPDGIYAIYEKSGDTVLDTGVLVTVSGADGEAVVNYYTVTFYDNDTAYGGDTPQKPQIVLSGQKAAKPAAAPAKTGYAFIGWMTEKDGNTAFNFDTEITEKKAVYASWKEQSADAFVIMASALEGGDISPKGSVEVKKGEDRTFTIIPREGHRVKSIVVDGAEAVADEKQTEGILHYTFYDVGENHTILVVFEEISETHGVNIKVRKDGQDWKGHNKNLGLSSDGGNTFIDNLSSVPDGVYKIYEKSGESTVDTGVSVTVAGVDEEAFVDYYTVTFYDGNAAYSEGTPQEPQIILSGQKASKPAVAPVKADYSFIGWMTEKDGDTAFNFDEGITEKKAVYASWQKPAADELVIVASATDGGDISPKGSIAVKKGEDQTFTITPREGYQVKSILVDGKEAVPDEKQSGKSAITAGKEETALAGSQEGILHYTFRDVRENHTISAEFEKKSSSKPGGDKPDKGDEPGKGNKPDDTDSGKQDSDISGDQGGKRENQAAGNKAVSAVYTVNAKNTENNAKKSAPDGKEPKTGDTTRVEVYATTAMIAGLIYIVLYFRDQERGMTQSDKDEIVMKLIRWAKKGGHWRRYAALAAILGLLIYYHSIGKRISSEWRLICAK